MSTNTADEAECAVEPWYIRAFGEHYPLLYRHRDDASAAAEVAQIVKLLNLTPGRRVLDVCCGGGRHLAAFRSLGFDAIGVDLSPTLLAEARKRPGLEGRLIRADIRSMPFESEFDAAVNLFTSFGYFQKDADNQHALRQMIWALKSGGRLLMDLINPAWLYRNFEPYFHRWVDRSYIRQHRQLTDRRVVNEIQITGPSGECRNICEDVRLYEPLELAAMFRKAGASAVRFFGSLNGEPYSSDSPRLIAIGSRA
jgi:SAM-dependent methyltransferase